MLFSVTLGTRMYNPYSAGIDFIRQILTSKVDSRTVRTKILLMVVDP